MAALLARPEVRWLSEELPPLLLELRGFTYRFLDLVAFEALLRDDRARAHRTYWLEILYRAHLAAATCLLRQDRWLRAASDASVNCLGFAAAIRGLLESGADAWFSLRFLPRFLAEKALLIVRILAGSAPANMLYSYEQAEEWLIHFQFARDSRYGPTGTPPTHRPEATTNYLETFESESALKLPVLRCYHALCNLTHPAADSLAFSIEAVPSGNEWHIAARSDEAVLRQLLSEFAAVFGWTVQSTANLCVLLLASINALGVSELHSPFVSRLDLSAIPEWGRIEGLLLSQGFSKRTQ